MKSTHPAGFTEIEAKTLERGSHACGAAFAGHPGPTGEQALDPWLFGAVAALCGLGLVMVYSASGWTAYSRFGRWTYFAERQAIFMAAGFAALWVVARLDYRILRRFAGFGLGLAFVALVTVALTGTAANGAKRWLGLGSLGIQPSELAKLALIIFLATTLAKQGERVRSFLRGFVPPMAALSLILILILAGSDLGNAVLLASTTLAMLWVAGARASFVLGAIFLGLPIGWLLVVFKDYRIARLVQFFSGEDFQVQQSLIAVGSGGTFGLGLGEGRQKLGLLAENHTDFIFAAIGEELGAVGMLATIGLYAVLVWRGLGVVMQAPDRFGAYLATGITAMFGMQALINFSVVLKLIPAKGITLPFISSGGSSLLVSLVAAGILLSISRCPQPSFYADLRRPLPWPNPLAWMRERAAAGRLRGTRTKERVERPAANRRR
jgi:cell division protein FtsW